MAEADTQRAILQYLSDVHIPAWRVNTQGVPLHGPGMAGKYRPAPNRGMSDIIGILPSGRFLAIEVKSKNGKASPEQERFLQTIQQAGGVSMIARDLAGVIAELKLCTAQLPYS